MIKDRDVNVLASEASVLRRWKEYFEGTYVSACQELFVTEGYQ